MPKYDTGFELLSRNLEKVLKSQSDNQKARTDFQNSLLLTKMKANYEQQIKSGEMKDKFGYDLALEKEKASMPFKAYQEFQSGQGNPGGAPNVTMGPDAKMRVLKLKDMAEQIYMKPPNTWSQQEKQIVEQYKAFTMATRPPQGAGTFDPFANLNQPGAQTQTQPIDQAKIDQARKAGYSDEEINAYLKGQ